MREWLAQTVERIMALRPKDVLEIGCGTGMLLARVAPHCATYVGLDFSGTALDHIRAMQGTVAGLERVSLYERAADNLTGFAPQSFDTVIVNSVVQHFPDADYLIQVLKGAAELVKPGGHILIGDVLNLSLLEAFHTSVQVYRAADTDTCAQVKKLIRQQVAQERDLMLAPGFFTAAANEIQVITHWEALPKRGRSRNQLTRFRYDAILHLGEPVEPAGDVRWLDWRKDRLTVTDVCARIGATRPDRLAIRNIPNARLDWEAAALPWLQEAGPGRKIAELRGYVEWQPARGVEPGDLQELEELGYRVELSWLNTDGLGSFDAILTRSDVPSSPARFVQEGPRRSWRDFSNHPQRAKLNRQLIPQLREFLQDKLPQYMMPAVFTVLDKMPLSPTGKVDRGSLAQLPTGVAPDAEEEVEVARSPVERLLAQAWADTLNVNHVGMEDNFFEMGGNSLKAMALTHQLQRQLNRPFRPVTLLQAPTIKQFADYMRTTYPDLAMEVANAGTFAPSLQEGDI
jgi:SAM-dependent methyltransferase/aryl carrier-like protein